MKSVSKLSEISIQQEHLCDKSLCLSALLIVIQISD